VSAPSVALQFFLSPSSPPSPHRRSTQQSPQNCGDRCRRPWCSCVCLLRNFNGVSRKRETPKKNVLVSLDTDVGVFVQGPASAERSGPGNCPLENASKKHWQAAGSSPSCGSVESAIFMTKQMIAGHLHRPDCAIRCQFAPFRTFPRKSDSTN